MTMLPIVLLALVATSSVHAARFMWMPGGDGRSHLVDLDMKVEKGRAVSDSDVTFHLYTRSNPTTSNVITIWDVNSLGPFDASKPTKVLIHGWESNKNTMRHVTEAWLAKGDYNNIVVDWSGPAGNLNYAQAKEDTVAVGAIIARLLDFLINQGLSLAATEIVGHSLGAHIAGIASYRTESDGVVHEIIGLDPAAPLFGDTPVNDRLDTLDAGFVQVIHTNGGLLGWMDPMGDADFYPNGGKSQTGCGLDLAGACSHNRSHFLFAESVTSTVGFRSLKCASYDDYENSLCNGNEAVGMGEPTPASTRGTFYLRTNDQEPYALG